MDNEKVPTPVESVAYCVNHLPPAEMVEGKLTKLQEQINSMKAHERKGKKQLSITRLHPEGQYDPDPYLIRYISAIYVGEWKYNSTLMSSVPGGIGRLYTEDEIMEG